MTPGTAWVSWITAEPDRSEHAVDDDAQVAGMTTGRGVYSAVCGAAFHPASMDIGPTGRCARCVRLLHARAQLRDLNHRMAPRRPRWLTRLRCRDKHTPGGRLARPEEKERDLDSGKQ